MVKNVDSRLRILASLLTSCATFNLSCLHFFICKMCSGPYLNRVIVYINKSIYVSQLEESQAQSTCYLFKYLSAIMLIRQALTKGSLVAARACCYISQIQIAQAWGVWACGAHELENFPPSLLFFCFIWENTFQTCFGEISTSIECSLRHNSRKGKELSAHMSYQGLFMCPVCFGNRTEINLNPEWS